MAISVQFDHVTKRYRRSVRPPHLREALTGWWRRSKPPTEFLALDDVSFQVETGETVGLIGPNGAGKSTILKLLSRITRPTSGRIWTQGKVAALLEAGAGFHPDLSGRENITLCGSIAGLTGAELKARFPAIVDFADLGPFLDTPMKRYSSGMQMRLGFSIAAHLDAPILLIDEVLAVGDLAFQKKCLDAIRAFRRQGRTILFVSHAMDSVATICDRIIFLKAGRAVADGAPDSVIDRYRRDVFGVHGHSDALTASSSDGVVDVTDVQIEDGQGSARRVFSTGETIALRVGYRTRRPVQRAVLHAAIYRSDGLLCFFTNTLASLGKHVPLAERGSFKITFPSVGLMPDSYVTSIRIDGPDLGNSHALVDRAHGFLIDASSGPVAGAFFMPHEWAVDGSQHQNGLQPGVSASTCPTILEECVSPVSSRV